MKRWLIPISVLLALSAGLTFAAETPAPAALDLAGAIRLALEADPQVTAAESGVTGAKAAVALQMAAISPGATIQAVYGRDASGEVSNRISFTIAQNRPGLLPPIISGKVASRVTQALWDLADAEAGLAQARIAAAATVAQKYLAAEKAGRLIGLRQSALDLAKDNVSVAAANLTAGTALKLDVLRAQSNQAGAELNLEQARLDSRMALDNLCLEIGWPLGTEIKLAQAAVGTAAAPASEDALVAAALKTDSEAITARTSVRKKESDVQARKNALLPDIALTIDEKLGVFTGAVGLDLTTGDVSWSAGGSWPESSGPLTPADGLSFGASFSWNILDGGAGKLQLEQAETSLKSAQENLAQIEAKIKLDLRQKLNDLRLAELRLSQARSAADLERQARAIALLRYEEGVALFSELGQATQTLAQVENDAIQAEYNLLLARIGLAQACGEMPAL